MTQATPDNHATGLPRLGHYHLLESIGRGGMGLVYRARDTRLERDVAVKCLRTELFEDHYIERFKREALLLAKLNHPNIVQIYDFIAAPEQVALVMELVDGQNLHTYLREHIVPISQRLQWLIQITEGLAVAHDAGIIHRDLKTENILINKRGQAKITDLGIAKSQDFNATLTDHVAGSYCSMSPEQAMGETITFKSDLFSLGILAYQLLCGAHPFGDTSNKLQTMQRIISHPPTAPQQHNPNLPGEFIDLLGQLLSKDPDKRPGNTHWVAAQFAKLRDLNWQEDLSGDDTQALAIPLPVNTKLTRTQDHPTFDTRFVAVATSSKVSIWKNIKHHLVTNKIAVSSAVVSILIIAGIAIWQLQPKPPKYVAVIPPKLIAEGMQESQQELVKGAVYDAIQQQVLQMQGYHLIPGDEIKQINDTTDNLRRATAADEIITIDIQCKVETCTINISRLAPEDNKSNSRLRVVNSKPIDVLTDNYLAIADTVSLVIRNFYQQHHSEEKSVITDKEYSQLIFLKNSFIKNGASDFISDELNKMSSSTKKTLTFQSFYRELTLALFHQNRDGTYLENLKQLLEMYPNKERDLGHLINLYHLQIAQRDNTYLKTEKSLSQLIGDSALMHELLAYRLSYEKDFDGAIANYKKSLLSKETAIKLFYIANCYWQMGNTANAKSYLDRALTLSPNHFESLSLYGNIWLMEGNIQNAIDSFKKVTDMNPKDAFNFGNLGLSYLLNHEYELASQSFGKAINLVPNNPPLILNQADSFLLSNAKQQAEELYIHAIELALNEAETSENLQLLAQAYAHLGDHSNALLYLKRLERSDPSGIGTIYTSALVNTLAGNNTSAVLNTQNSLEAGMDIRWFYFPWFDHLCQITEFRELMNKKGEHQRCSPQ